MSPLPLDELLDYTGASRLLGIPKGTLTRWVHHGRIPHIRLGDRTVRFSPTELRDWINEHRVRSARSLTANMDASAQRGGGQ